MEINSTMSNFLDPESIIAQIDLKKGSLVADFGCASGYFSLPFAKAIGSEGHLMALDILPQALETVESRSKSMSISNVQTNRVNLERENGSCLEDDSLDWVIMKGILFQNQNKPAILREAYRVLKRGGKAIIVEWGNENFAIGPHKSLRILEDVLMELAKNEGFLFEKKVDAGKFHYAFVVIK